MGTGINGTIFNLLVEWWGVDDSGTFPVVPNFSLASNLFQGSNLPFQISDFLAIYPKFGTQVQGLQAVAPGSTPGSGYAVNDVLALVQFDAQGGTVRVLAVGAGGVPTSYAVVTPGSGYSVASALATTGGTGTGAQINVSAITPYVGVIPAVVLQLYINLASACLQSARWGSLWTLAMAEFVAHFATLYLRSEGNFGTTPGQIAASGLERGILVSKSAGNVSAGIQTVGLDGWGAWQETAYGTKLATWAKVVGMGPMYIP